MTTFAATVESQAEIAASRDDVWKVLTDTAELARLTPLLTGIDDHGQTWVWHMANVEALGVHLQPIFTEAMVFDEGRRISFTHAVPLGTTERIGVEGHYDLTDTARGVHLAILLTVTADLPLPRLATPAVTRVMKQTMTMMGERFARNLLAKLGAAPV